jgi:pimeloyl-ACP methyl ester carboxylesterase
LFRGKTLTPGRRLRAAVFVATLAALIAGPAAHARPSACGTMPGLVCSTVVVPLDRTGLVAGSIALHVEVLPPEGPSRGTLFLVAGGPGQGSAHVFGLGNGGSVGLFRFLFAGYTLVAYDDRGTGDSGLLDCPLLQTAVSADQQQAQAAACATIIGPQRDFYSTAQHAEDMDAVRQSLGVDKIALFGVSYGTKLSLAYALAHPDHVERMVLDSVLPPESPDPYSADVLRAMPATLNAFCSDGGCRAATPNFSADVVLLANKYAAKPLVGTVLEANGKRVSERIDGIELLATLLDADLNPAVAAELPATMHAARLGNTQPLLRLAHLHDLSNAAPSVELSSALYAATVCRDGPFPWAPETPIQQRPAVYQSAVAALPAGTFGPFGTWAARFGNADFCLKWPSPSGGATLNAGPLPNVPVLALSGGFDMRTPTGSAVSVVSRFPQGHLLVVPGVGHSVTTADPSGCAANAVRAWFANGTIPPAACPRGKPLVPVVGPLPAAKQPAHVSPLATYAIAAKTLREAEATWVGANEKPLPGVYSGRLVPGPRSFTLVRYSIAPGVELSGTIRLANADLPLLFSGTVKVGGPRAAIGILGLTEKSLRGTLGGRLVG